MFVKVLRLVVPAYSARGITILSCCLVPSMRRCVLPSGRSTVRDACRLRSLATAMRRWLSSWSRQRWTRSLWRGTLDSGKLSFLCGSDCFPIFESFHLFDQVLSAGSFWRQMSGMIWRDNRLGVYRSSWLDDGFPYLSKSKLGKIWKGLHKGLLQICWISLR